MSDTYYSGAMELVSSHWCFKRFLGLHRVIRPSAVPVSLHERQSVCIPRPVFGIP